MPMYELGIHVSTDEVKARRRRKNFALELGEATFNRTGEDGKIDILPLCGGDEYVGEVLPGEWKKGWDTDIDGGSQPFVAKLSGTGELYLLGDADVAGTPGDGWINGHHPIILMDGTEVTVEMEVPISDTGAVADRDIDFRFLLRREKEVDNPLNDENRLLIHAFVDENGLIYFFGKTVNNSWTQLFSGSTYDDTSVQDESADKFTIWRMVFHDGHYGEISPNDARHVHVYLKQADTRNDAESAEENQLSTSPYDISDMYFEIAYPAYMIRTENDTYFEATTEAVSTYLRISYPDHDLRTLLPKASVRELKGESALWDGDPDSGGVRVFDTRHEFEGDCYVQNGLLRIHIDEGGENGFKILYWTGSAWSMPFNQFYIWLPGPSMAVYYTYLEKVVYWSPEKTIIRVKFVDSPGEDDDDFYCICDITLERGKLHFKMAIMELYPPMDYRPVWGVSSGSTPRWGYCGDDLIGDGDLDIEPQNTTMTDNFMLMFDDDGPAVIAFMGCRLEPLYFLNIAVTVLGNALMVPVSYNMTHLKTVEFSVGLIPFALIANLFEEAEDATLGGGASVETDAAASGGDAVMLDAQWESVRYEFTGDTELPQGRYLCMARIRDINLVSGDVGLLAYNATDSNRYISQENETEFFTATATYAFYGMVFDIGEWDGSGDTLNVRVRKELATANEIYVDYFLIIPIGNGQGWPQDQAHAAARLANRERRIFEK